MATIQSNPFGVEVLDVVIRSDTFHSIGIRLDLLGTSNDADYNAVVSVEYRKVGDAWSDAMDLVRNDYTWDWGGQTGDPISTFAGSIFFLTPGTEYEMRLTYADPDAADPLDGVIYTTTTTTRAIPVKPTPTNTYYVHQGHGGANDGSSGAPFNSLNSANAAAVPGDLFLLRDTGGPFAKGIINTSGGEDNHIVYEPDTGHSPVIDAIEIIASHVWMDKLAFAYVDQSPGTPIENQPWADTSAVYVPFTGEFTEDNIVTDCTFDAYFNGVHCNYALARWVVMDNTMVGWQPVDIAISGTPGNSSGKGIMVGGEGKPGGTGNIVAYNSITRFSDAIGVSNNNDCYGNRVWDLEDDCVSTDDHEENVRVWGNLLHYCGGNNTSYQPQREGPWYFLYNQLGQTGFGIFKFRAQDRIVFINNTILGGAGQAHYFMRCILRNNLFIQQGSVGQLWSGNDQGNEPTQYVAGWNTDVDYDGFDYSSASPFSWFDPASYYPDLDAFRTAVPGIEQNATLVDANLIFDDYTISPTNSMELAAGSNLAVEAGQVVNNISDWHGASPGTTAPDLGAHQRGATAMQFGPRSGDVLGDKAENWIKH